MKRDSLKMALIISGAIFLCRAYAQEILHPFIFDDTSVFRNISNNGKWATAYASTGDGHYSDPKLVDLTTYTVKELLGKDNSEMVYASANDVTDDGSMVVGSRENQPAIYLTASQRWWILNQLPDSCTGGIINAITPDGRFAVGKGTYPENEYTENIAFWDLTHEEPELVQLPDIPLADMVGDTTYQRRLTDIAPDGNTVLGCVSYSYVQPAGIYYFIYNRSTRKFQPIGFDVSKHNGKAVWTPRTNGLYYIETAQMSANGAYITGEAYFTFPTEDPNIPRDERKGYVYDIMQDKFSVIEAQEEMPGFVVSDDGLVLGATPSSNPYRDWGAYIGKYWYPIELILNQRYGINFSASTGFTNTGTPAGISGDGKNIIVFTGPQKEGYVLSLPETLDEAAVNIDLLGNYNVTPKANSEFSALKTATFTFPYEIELLGDRKNVSFTDGSGNSTGIVASLKAQGKELTAVFRSASLKPTVKYTLKIAANTIAIKGDTERKNKEICVTYTGRANTPVKMTAVTPYENTEVKQINYTTNPVIVTFDTQLSLNENATGYLYKDDETVPDGILRLGVTDNKLYVFPTVARNLFKDHDYKVTIPKNAVYDITGGNGNDSITLHYKGGYEREISYDNDTIYIEDFARGFGNVMLYEGDHNEPSDEMKKLDFVDADNYPWTAVRDEDDKFINDAASTEIYTPAGKSDDWLITPHLYIPDDRCYLQFDAQSYRDNKKDSLYVLVWATEDEYSSMNSERISKFKAECDTIYAGVETPGYEEDFLAGDWTEHVVQLPKYAGKNIYIAFVNSNEDQSCVFIDNLLVRQDQKFQISVGTDKTMVKAENATIAGQLRITSPESSYTTLKLTLKDAQGNQIDQISETGLDLVEGDKYDFSFGKALPLETGISNTYSILVQLDDEQSEPHYYIKNLAFQTVKRVVLEEGTGQDCPNCPQGILAIENLEHAFGDQFLPISLHTYQGDELGTGFSNYNSFLGISAFPSGIVNRNTAPVFPVTTDENGKATFTSTTSPCWLDYVNKEMEVAADADFNFTKAQLESDSTINVAYNYKYALDVEGQNVNLFTVVVEDSVKGRQSNNYSAQTDPLFGEWGKGGKYGSSLVIYYHPDVVRGVIGESFYGTPGYIQPNVEAGEEYTTEYTFKLPAQVSKAKNCKIVTMMIDANSGKVINSARATLDASNFNSIADTQIANDRIKVEIQNGGVEVTTEVPAQVSLYRLDGTLIGTAQGNGTISLSSNGYCGLTLVKVTTGTQTLVKKVIVK